MKQLKNILLAIIIAAIAASCEHKEAAVEQEKFVLSDTMQKMIQLDTVRECSMSGELTLSGMVGFNDNNVVRIFPRSSGQVLETRVSAGDKVSKGQALAVIKSADVAGSYNDLASANAELATAKRQMENVESLFKNGISSEKEYHEAKQNYQKALAARDKVQSMISINGGGRTSENGRYVLTSPIDGYVVEKKVTAGAFIRQDMSDNLFTISNLKNVWIYANVYEADIPKVKEGNAVKVYALSYPDRPFTGTINRTGQTLDPQSKTMKVRVEIDNSEMLLKPDMFVKVIVGSTGGGMATCIPATAIIAQDGKSYVVVYKSPEEMHIAEVEVLKTVEGKAYVRGEVKAGERVVTQNQLFIFSKLEGE